MTFYTRAKEVSFWIVLGLLFILLGLNIILINYLEVRAVIMFFLGFPMLVTAWTKRTKIEIKPQELIYYEKTEQRFNTTDYTFELVEEPIKDRPLYDPFTKNARQLVIKNKKTKSIKRIDIDILKYKYKRLQEVLTTDLK